MSSDEPPVGAWLGIAAAVALLLAIPVGLYSLWLGVALLVWGLVLWLLSRKLSRN